MGEPRKRITVEFLGESLTNGLGSIGTKLAELSARFQKVSHAPTWSGWAEFERLFPEFGDPEAELPTLAELVRNHRSVLLVEVWCSNHKQGDRQQQMAGVFRTDAGPLLVSANIPPPRHANSGPKRERWTPAPRILTDSGSWVDLYCNECGRVVTADLFEDARAALATHPRRVGL
jgi:hypothetical protein